MSFDLTHLGRVTHICVDKLTVIGSDNGLSPGRRQLSIWSNAGVLLIGLLGTNISEISMEINIFSFKKFQLKLWTGKCTPFCLGLCVLWLYPYDSGICPAYQCSRAHRYAGHIPESYWLNWLTQQSARNLVTCRYDTVQYNMIFYTAPQWLKHNMNQSLF